MAQARVELLKTVVFDQGLYHGNGDVIKWCRLITAKFTMEARRYAPVRSGELVAGISGTVRHVGVRQVEGIIQSKAPHTMWVLRGTTGPISRKKFKDNPEGASIVLWKDVVRHGKKRRERVPVRQKGYWMKLPAGGDFPVVYKTEVAGQDANNFLEKAWRATSRNHRAIRGAIPTFITSP